MFDISKYLMKIRTREGQQDYLKVAGRILALHNAYPDGGFAIELSVVELSDDRATFIATVRLPNGTVTQNAGSETRGDFNDFIEKAATKAIGRALASAGFGTEYALADFDIGEGEERKDSDMPRVVDAPVPSKPASTRPDNLATGKQIGLIRGLARENGLSEEDLNAWALRTHGVTSIWNLERAQASALIDLIKVKDPTLFVKEDDDDVPF
jgi:hypothetical protein